MGPGGLCVGVLGPLQVATDAGPVEIGAPKQRALLALLALRAGHSVGVDQLIDGLWGEEPPRSATKTLQTYVSGIRRLLPDGAVRTVPGGYELVLDPADLDASIFEQLIGSARQSQATGDLAQATEQLNEALALWRGPTLVDVLPDLTGVTVGQRLDELRRVAVEDLADLLLEAGEHQEVIADLEAAVTEEPLRERRRAQLMIALYRSGRQADALSVYRQTRQTLAEELGIEPSPVLQGLEFAILNQSPELNSSLEREVATTVRKPPSGTMTFLFSDIEGSSRLWEQAPEAMATALERHDELLRFSIEGSGGYVFKTVGDAFCSVFATAKRALQAAAEAQRVLAVEVWPEGLILKVRMALHTGECDERDGDYFGPTVNRVARLEAIAHGGQVLISQSTVDVVRDRLPAGLELRELGRHVLKDLSRPEMVWQLIADDLLTDFPPLRSLDNPALSNNLPAFVSSFVGREAEVAETRRLLEESRLVTLTGAGGVGKTRLGLQVAVELLDESGDGVWLVELAALDTSDLVDVAVMKAVGLREKRIVLQLTRCSRPSGPSACS